LLKKIDNADTYTPSDVKRLNWRRISLGMFQALLMIAIIAASGLVAKTMISGKPPTKKRPAFKTVYTVNTVIAHIRDYQPKFVSYGQIAAARSVELRSLVSGEIISVNPGLRTGSSVAKGAPLLEIDSFSYQGALQEAKANFAEAKAKIVENQARISLEESRLSSAKEQMQFAQADLTRASKLRKRGTSTQQQLEARKLVLSQRNQVMIQSRDTIKVEQARLSQLNASLQRLQWRIDQAQRNLDSTILKSPFNGTIRSSSAERGRLVNANDVVVSMYEAGLLEVRFTLTDAQYGRLQTRGSGLIGRPVDISWIVGGKTYSWPGAIDRLGAEITSNRGGVEVFASVKDADNGVTIRPGAFVEVRVPDMVFANSVSVPDTAIYGTDTIYVVIDGKLVKRAVTIATFDGQTALISSGLKDGDEVLTTRITEISEGLAVRTEEKLTEEQIAETLNVGAPSRKELRALLKDQELSNGAFQSLTRGQKRTLVQSWRAKNAAKSSD